MAPSLKNSFFNCEISIPNAYNVCTLFCLSIKSNPSELMTLREAINTIKANNIKTINLSLRNILYKSSSCCCLSFTINPSGSNFVSSLFTLVRLAPSAKFISILL
ncbi:MAG: hypothetical protein BWX61_01384 [Bacteroidetes bacterium ADurb.Bin035]|nr:MAG: hypothetical protein BWX61_01384 [Bacteroidetes bacterium ADurb.Bin035]